MIFAAAGHDIAWEIVQRLNGRISRLRALTLASTNRRVSGPVHMARIAGAIAANDPSAEVQAEVLRWDEVPKRTAESDSGTGR